MTGPSSRPARRRALSEVCRRPPAATELRATVDTPPDSSRSPRRPSTPGGHATRSRSTSPAASIKQIALRSQFCRESAIRIGLQSKHRRPHSTTPAGAVAISEAGSVRCPFRGAQGGYGHSAGKFVAAARALGLPPRARSRLPACRSVCHVAVCGVLMIPIWPCQARRTRFLPQLMCQGRGFAIGLRATLHRTVARFRRRADCSSPPRPGADGASASWAGRVHYLPTHSVRRSDHFAVRRGVHAGPCANKHNNWHGISLSSSSAGAGGSVDCPPVIGTTQCDQGQPHQPDRAEIRSRRPTHPVKHPRCDPVTGSPASTTMIAAFSVLLAL